MVPATGVLSSGVDDDPIAEVVGEEISEEQLQRMANRYLWAGKQVAGCDVLEVACGSGQGLAYLASHAKSLAACDYSEKMLAHGRALKLPNVELSRLDAQNLSYADDSFDVIIMFEALYYVPKPDLFFAECRRLLRPGGKLLIATANKDLFDFNPSPNSFEYLGVVELEDRLSRFGFDTVFFGDTAVSAVSLRQRALRPMKAVARRLGLIPKTNAGKLWLKRIVFGKTMPMPASVDASTCPYETPAAIPGGQPNREYKVVFCQAAKTQEIASGTVDK